MKILISMSLVAFSLFTWSFVEVQARPCACGSSKIYNATPLLPPPGISGYQVYAMNEDGLILARGNTAGSFSRLFLQQGSSIVQYLTANTSNVPSAPYPLLNTDGSVVFYEGLFTATVKYRDAAGNIYDIDSELRNALQPNPFFGQTAFYISDSQLAIGNMPARISGFARNQSSATGFVADLSPGISNIRVLPADHGTNPLLLRTDPTKVVSSVLMPRGIAFFKIDEVGIFDLQQVHPDAEVVASSPSSEKFILSRGLASQLERSEYGSIQSTPILFNGNLGPSGYIGDMNECGSAVGFLRTSVPTVVISAGNDPFRFVEIRARLNSGPLVLSSAKKILADGRILADSQRPNGIDLDFYLLEPTTCTEDLYF